MLYFENTYLFSLQRFVFLYHAHKQKEGSTHPNPIAHAIDELQPWFKEGVDIKVVEISERHL